MKILACIFITLSFIDFYRVDYKIIHPNVEIGKSGIANAQPVIKDVSLLNKQFEADEIINFFNRVLITKQPSFFVILLTKESRL